MNRFNVTQHPLGVPNFVSYQRISDPPAGSWHDKTMTSDAPAAARSASPNWRDTALTRLLGNHVPVVLGAFGGASSVELTAAVSNAGGLGSYGLYGYSGERILDTAHALRAATDRPFALNLWLPHTEPDEGAADVDDVAFAAAAARLAPLFAAVGLEVPLSPPSRYLPAFSEQLDAVIEAAPAVLSLVFGVPDAALIERCRDRGIRVIATATTVDEGVALAAAGVDAVVASGMEAGGHRVSFLGASEDSLVGTMARVPQLVDALHAAGTEVPVIAAGGIGDARGLAASLMLGASGAMLGTAFLATRESTIAPAYRALLHGPRARLTVLTRVMSGRLSRGIPNIATAAIVEPAAFPVQNWLTGQFRSRASEQGNVELLSLWAGQAAGLSRDIGAAELMRELVDGADRLLGR